MRGRQFAQICAQHPTKGSDILLHTCVSGRKPLVRGLSQRSCGHNSQGYTHVILGFACLLHRFCTGCSTGAFAGMNESGDAGSTTENAKRPSAGTRRPLLIHPLATTNGGTMPESTDGRFAAAVTHLNLIERNAAEFVRLAFVYGLTVDRIARESGLRVATVRRILAGGVR